MSNFQEKIERAFDMFESSFINDNNELILHREWNIYFCLSDIASEQEFDYKLLSYLSFYTASNHFKKSSTQYKWASNRIRRWFRKNISYEDLQLIYQKLGCGIDKERGVEFINSNLNTDILKEDLLPKKPKMTKCAECDRGGNGNAKDKCSCGWQIYNKSDPSGCYLGTPIIGEIKPREKLSRSKERYSK